MRPEAHVGLPREAPGLRLLASRLHTSSFTLKGSLAVVHDIYIYTYICMCIYIYIFVQKHVIPTRGFLT